MEVWGSLGIRGSWGFAEVWGIEVGGRKGWVQEGFGLGVGSRGLGSEGLGSRGVGAERLGVGIGGWGRKGWGRGVGIGGVVVGLKLP